MKDLNSPYKPILSLLRGIGSLGGVVEPFIDQFVEPEKIKETKFLIDKLAFSCNLICLAIEDNGPDKAIDLVKCICTALALLSSEAEFLGTGICKLEENKPTTFALLKGAAPFVELARPLATGKGSIKSVLRWMGSSRKLIEPIIDHYIDPNGTLSKTTKSIADLLVFSCNAICCLIEDNGADKMLDSVKSICTGLTLLLPPILEFFGAKSKENDLALSALKELPAAIELLRPEQPTLCYQP